MTSPATSRPGFYFCFRKTLREIINLFSSIQFTSVAQSRPTLCDPMDCSTPGLPVHHQLLEFTQTHVHRVGDAIQPAHPFSSPSPPAFNLSFHFSLQSFFSSESFQMSQLFSSGGQRTGVFQLKHQSFQRIFRTDFL